MARAASAPTSRATTWRRSPLSPRHSTTSTLTRQARISDPVSRRRFPSPTFAGQSSASSPSGYAAPHNILVRDDGSIRVLDFEYSGWDDPVISSGDFLASDSCQGLSSACTLAYVHAFRELAQLSDDEIARSRHVAALMEIVWSVVHLSLVVPERFAVKQFADPAFDVDAHVAYQLTCFWRRLRQAERIVPEILIR
jgi:hypothetical protein